MIKNNVNIEDLIENNTVIGDSRFDGTFTKTALFLMPAIGINIYSQDSYEYFINAFLDDKEHKHDYDLPIFVLTRCKGFSEANWKKYYQFLSAKEEYVGDYDCGLKDGYNYVMFVFQFPSEFRSDYYHFKRGRYTQFSKVFQDLHRKEILVQGVRKYSIAYGAIHKEEYIKKLVSEKLAVPLTEMEEMPEVWGIPTKEREYYRYLEQQNGRQS